MRRWHVGGLLMIIALWSGVGLASAGAGITYHGRLLKADGTPVTSSSVQFQIQIRTPGSENCLMYQETQTKDLSGTSGVFSITINDGTATTPNTEPFTLSELFKNSGSFSFGAGKCSGSSTYSPNSTDGRKLAVSFNDGSGWETLPAQEINFVPMALESESVGGKTPSSFLRVDSSAESSNTTELTTTDLTHFWDLLNGTSSQYMKSSSSNGANLPPLSGAPTAPAAGTIWYDSTNNKIKYFDGTTTQTVGTSGGSVTGITVGTGLVDGSGNTGTTITTSGTIKLPAVGTADTYYKVTTDAEGRVTTGSTSLAESDLPTISTAGKVSGSAITSGTIGGSTAINSSGNITTSGNMSSTNLSATTASLQTLRLFESTNTHKVTMTVPTSLAADYSLVLPPDDGTSGQVLSTDGSGNLSWISPSTGSVTSVTASAPLSVDTTTASSPALSISKADTSTDGYLSSTDWTTFNNKLSAVANTASLSDGKVWIGDSSGKAQEKSLSGDVGLTNAGVASVNKIKGYGLDFSTAPASGDFLKYTGTNWTAAAITESDVSGLSTDLDDKISSSQMPANCTSGQTLTFSSPTGTWACSDITVSGSNFASQTANTVLAAPDGAAGTPTFRTLTANDLPSGIATQWSDGTGGAIYYNGGNVGIGTTTPGSSLTVSGRLEADGGLLLNQGSGATDNLIYAGSSSTGSVDASMGFFVAGVGSGSAGDGPYFLGRGNSFSAISKQRGNVYLAAGNPTSPDPAEGSINFWTGNEQSRMTIANDGNIGIGMTTPYGKVSIFDDGYDGTTDIMTASYLPGLSILSGSDYVGLTSLDRDGDMTTTTDDKDGMLYWGDNTDDNFRFASVTSNQATTRMIITGTGDVGIGVTAPSEKFEVNGNVKATAFIGDGSQLTGVTASGVSSGAGTAAAPSMTFSSDTDTGFYSSGTNQIGVSAGGTNIFNLSSLGLTSPTSGGGVMTTAAGTSSAPTFSFSGDTDTGWYHPAADTLAAATGGTERMRIDASGSVGIGTASPQAPLDVLSSATGSVTSAYFRSNPGGAGSTNQNTVILDNTQGLANWKNSLRFASQGNVKWSLGNDVMGAGNQDFFIHDAVASETRLVIDSAGNIGMGTTSPSDPLHIYSTSTLGTIGAFTLSNAILRVQEGATGSLYMDGNTLVSDVPTGLMFGSNEASSPLIFIAGGDEKMRVSSVGNVGIGTTNPGARLELVGGAGIVPGILASNVDTTNTAKQGLFGTKAYDTTQLPFYAFQAYTDATSNNAYIGGSTGYGNAATDLIFVTAANNTTPVGTERMRINRSGNVGIGTTTPSTRLDITDSSTASGNHDLLRVGDASNSAVRMGYLTDGTSTTSVYLRSDNSKPLTLGTTATIGSGGAVTIANDGDVGIGTTNPQNKLDVINKVHQANVPTEYVAAITNAHNTTSKYGLIVGTNWNSSENFIANFGNYQAISGNFTSYMAIKGNGYVGIGTTNPAYTLDVVGAINSSTSLKVGGVQVCTASGCTSSSDRRLKKNIEPLKDSLDDVLKLQGVSYDWKNSKKFGEGQRIGFIAQDLEKVYPQVVRTDKKTGLKSVAYDHLIAPVIEAIKALYKDLTHQGIEINKNTREIASVKADASAKIAKLEAENAKLKARADKAEHENLAIKAWICTKDPKAAICSRSHR